MAQAEIELLKRTVARLQDDLNVLFYRVGRIEEARTGKGKKAAKPKDEGPFDDDDNAILAVK